jgi:hypothetical protein
MRLDLHDRAWHPIDNGLLPYLLGGMRAVWVFALVGALAGALHFSGRGLLSFPAILALLALSTAVAQTAAFRIRSERRGRLFVGCAGLLAVGLALYVAFGAGRFALWDSAWLVSLANHPIEAVAIVLFAAWLWWWGLLAGRETPGYDTYAANFALGIFALGVAVILHYAVDPLGLSTTLAPILAFFALGLASLAIASLRSTARSQAASDPSAFRLTRYWAITVAVVIAALLLGGLLLAQLFTPSVVSRLVAALSGVVDVAARILYWVILGIAWAAFKVFGLIGRLVHFPRLAGADVIIQAPPSLADQFGDLQEQPVGLSPTAYLVFRIAGAVLVATVVFLLFAMAFRRFRTYSEEDVEEQRESVLSLDLLRAQLGNLLKSRRRAPEPPPFGSIVGGDPTAQVRRVYQALLAWAADGAGGRPPGVTPLEYLANLNAAHPEQGAALATITNAYLEARYGLDPISEGVASAASEAWRQLREAVI